MALAPGVTRHRHFPTRFPVLRPIASLVRNSAPVAVVLSLAPFALLSAACSSSSGDGTNPDGGAGTSADDAASSGSSSGGGTASGATSSGGSSSGGSSSGATSSGGDAAPTGEAGSSGGGAGPASVVLGTAGNYVILAESAMSNVPTSVTEPRRDGPTYRGGEPIDAATRWPECTALSMYPASASVCSPANHSAPWAWRSSGQKRIICPGR